MAPTTCATRLPPHVESAVIDGYGHCLSEERSDELADLLRRFFDQTPRS
jgi:pimeloyl-ACP methyl ester carboxylesterase